MPLTLTQADYNEFYYTAGGAVGGYDNYREDSYITETAQQLAAAYIAKLIANGINPVGKKVLVLGCAYGLMVKYLVQQGVDAYGMEWSPWAIAQVPPEIAGRIINGSALVAANYDAAKLLAGLTKKQDKFDVIIDEDMIGCFTDAQVAVFEPLAKSYCTFLMHYMEDGPHLGQWYNYRTPAQWKAFVGNDPKEKWYSRLTWVEAI